eukprot:TRINITY_DN8417_c0_g1_i1.p2 TRINITY_DN8417_c0_g1~~TRINITY_DN8417_c0_g1_i1.p2  ORF type:complete len:117 (+),score=10.84 TRINITY_DN8417_c0_g1_i1:147-497(+)
MISFGFMSLSCRKIFLLSLSLSLSISLSIRILIICGVLFLLLSFASKWAIEQDERMNLSVQSGMLHIGGAQWSNQIQATPLGTMEVVDLTYTKINFILHNCWSFSPTEIVRQIKNQ